jgi:hypothetical protein
MIGECEGFSRVWQVASLGWRFQQVRHVGKAKLYSSQCQILKLYSLDCVPYKSGLDVRAGCGRIWADEAAKYSNPLAGWRVCAGLLHLFSRARVGWPTDWSRLNELIPEIHQ